jgi:aerobic carbon-monoxide dehydrogenase medium subunit
MKPAAFSYFAPKTLAEALEILARSGPDGRVLAGGQSLVPAMNFRLARPETLVDINRIPGLAEIRTVDGKLAIGALARHARFEQPVVDGPLGVLLPKVARHIAHLPIRLRGTFAGSIAHADPASEWCTLAVALDADIVVQSASVARTIPAGTFFKSIFTTDLNEGEMIVEVRLPHLGTNWHCGFEEFSRRAGDFAIVAALASLRIDHGEIADARIALGGVINRPVRSRQAESVLAGQKPAPELFREAARQAAEEFDPLGDIHGSAEYKSDLVAVMVRRALEQAAAS